MKIISVFMVILLFTGSIFTSCKKHTTEPPSGCDTCSDTTHHNCDTCNLNQDSLQRVKDSLSHAFVWTEYSIPGESNLTGVWVFDSNNILIVGNYLWKYDGVSFIQLHGNNTTYHSSIDGILNGNSVFAFSPLDYWLVYGGVTLHTSNGKDFVDIRPGHTNASWGTSSSDIFVVGNGGQIHHFDGTSFTDMVSPTTKDLRSVWGTSHNDVWACGFNPSTAESVLLHFDGTSWVLVDLSKIGNIHVGAHALGEVWASDSSGHKVVVTGGSLLWRETDEQLWRSDSGMIQNRISSNSFIGLFHIRGNTINDFVATGDAGFISHWNGKTWHLYQNLYNESNPLYTTNGVSMKDNTICTVGSKNGSSWVAIGRRAKF